MRWCIRILKRSGLRTPPCGIPKHSKRTLDHPLLRYPRTHRNRFPITPMSTSCTCEGKLWILACCDQASTRSCAYWTRLWWSALGVFLLKAFLMSCYMDPTCVMIGGIREIITLFVRQLGHCWTSGIASGCLELDPSDGRGCLSAACLSAALMRLSSVLSWSPNWLKNKQTNKKQTENVWSANIVVIKIVLKIPETSVTSQENRDQAWRRDQICGKYI